MTTPAGWYDDGSGNRRWWDGAQWTEHVVTGQQPSPAQQSAAQQATPQAEATAVDAASTPLVAPPSEPEPFVPPYTLAPQTPSAPVMAPGQAGIIYPGYADLPGAASPVAPTQPPAKGVPVVGIIGLAAVVAGIVCVCFPVIAIAGWGLLAAGFVMSLISLFLRGRKWPGITGLALAVVGSIVAVAVSFVIMLAATSFSPSAGEDPSEIEGAEMVPFAELEVGDCLPYVDYGDQEQIFELPVVSCDRPHAEEVYFIYDLEDGEFPGEDVVGDAAWNGCVAEFEAYVGIAYEDSMLDFYSYQPTSMSWSGSADRTVQCILYSYEDVSGSLRNAGY